MRACGLCAAGVKLSTSAAAAAAMAQTDACFCVFVRAQHLCSQRVSARRHKRGCVPNCDATHSCTADHAFSAGPCCTASRWRSWRRNPAPGDARSWLFLWPPSPSLSAALCLGSYPAGEQGRQAQGEVEFLMQNAAHFYLDATVSVRMTLHV